MSSSSPPVQLVDPADEALGLALGRGVEPQVAESGVVEAGGVALCDGERGGADGRGAVALERWCVVHTRSRQEKAVADALAAAGVRTYLPLVRRVRFYGHRKRSVELPLFSCYLFVWGPPEARYRAISTKRVAQVIDVHDQSRLEHELRNLQSVLERGAAVELHPFLCKGRRVRVTSGPFKGVEGLVEESPRQDRLVLQIHTLGRAASLEIDASLLEPLD